MYYQNYEEYMRRVLGYPIEQQNTYESNLYSTMPFENQMFPTIGNYSDEIMNLYPDIYKLIQPMVQKICEANSKPITKELIDKMTEEVYLNLESVPEADTVINIRVNTPKSSKESETSKQPLTWGNKTNNLSTGKVEEVDRKVREREKEEKREDRQRVPNRTLQDLIRILILNQLLGINRPQRPRPPRPPFPGPGNPTPRPPRPPFPRDDRYYDGLI